MKRRDFIGRLLGGAALAVASLYVPSKPWGAAVPKPPLNRSGGFFMPQDVVARIERAFDLPPGTIADMPPTSFELLEAEQEACRTKVERALAVTEF